MQTKTCLDAPFCHPNRKHNRVPASDAVASGMDAGAQHGLYAALGLTFAAELNLDDVKKAYRKMSLKYHPVRVCCM